MKDPSVSAIGTAHSLGFSNSILAPVTNNVINDAAMFLSLDNMLAALGLLMGYVPIV